METHVIVINEGDAILFLAGERHPSCFWCSKVLIFAARCCDKISVLCFVIRFVLLIWLHSASCLWNRRFKFSELWLFVLWVFWVLIAFNIVCWYRLVSGIFSIHYAASSALKCQEQLVPPKHRNLSTRLISLVWRFDLFAGRGRPDHLRDHTALKRRRKPQG